MGASPTLDQRVQAVERLTKLFGMERNVYLAVCIASLVMLLVSAGFIIFKHQASIEVLTPMFGSSGLITISLVRVLHMWDKALEFLEKMS